LEIDMTVTVETLEKLERKITLTLPADVIRNEVASSAWPARSRWTVSVQARSP
jgi:FKBP-type peptidyl-prolyl cis-trans isomerase (trigger factor)